MLRSYEQPFRPAYEGFACLAWLAGAAYFCWQAASSTVVVNMVLALAILCAGMAFVRGKAAIRILTLRASLSGRAIEFMTQAQLRAVARDPQVVYFGKGFEWLPKHTQRLYDLQRIALRGVVASPWLMRLLGKRIVAQPEQEIGQPYIHGVEPTEKNVTRPLANLQGGTKIVGSTRTGKGVLLTHLGAQAVYRGDCVIVIDPKNSHRLRDNIRYACEQGREPDTFLEFHPAFPEKGIRLDPTYNFQKVTELASRIKALLPPSREGSFENFAWDAVNVVCQACVALEDRPNLLKIKRYIEGGIEPLLLASLQRHFTEHAPPDWRDRLREFRPPRNRNAPPASDELAAMVHYYETEIARAARSLVIDSQVRVFKHPREHYQRIIASVIPILNSLTSGALGRSLAPDPFDPADQRPIFNLDRIIRGKHVLYLCLDALPDAQVAGAIASLFLSDLAAYLGMRYNLGQSEPRISLFIDESASCLSLAAIEIANKGAEAGCNLYLAMQTFADLAARLGSQDVARQALGNLNNMLAFRSIDRDTQQYIAEMFGMGSVQQVKHGIVGHIDDHVPDFSAGYSRQLSETEVERIPLHVLSELPDCQYFASLGGRIYKGRVPILIPERPQPQGRPALAAAARA